MDCPVGPGRAAGGLLRAAHAHPSNEPWNGGIWNSVLGYEGPTNTLVAD